MFVCFPAPDKSGYQSPYSGMENGMVSTKIYYQFSLAYIQSIPHHTIIEFLDFSIEFLEIKLLYDGEI